MKTSTVLACALMLVGVGLVVQGAGSGASGRGGPWQEVWEAINGNASDISTNRAGISANAAAIADLSDQIDDLGTVRMAIASVMLYPLETREVVVLCEAQELALGGGLLSGPPWVLILDSSPLAPQGLPIGWSVTVFNTHMVYEAYVTAYAICAKVQ